MRIEDAWLRLAMTPGIPLIERHRLLAAADGDPVRALSDRPDNGSTRLNEWIDVACATDVGPELRWLDGRTTHLVHFDSSVYPELLRHIPDPPLALLVRGDVNVLNAPSVAMVGSRKSTPAGCERARDFAAALASSGVCVVSGLARGIDAGCHRGALAVERHGTTVAVMATGPDRVYPAVNRRLAEEIAERGALVTEFRCGASPLRYHFPHRNRIVSGLASATLVVEAALKSGSLITARLAADQGRDVFAVPGSVDVATSRGCHELIRSGAGLVESPEQLLEQLGIPSSPPVTGCPPQAELERCMEDDPPAFAKVIGCIGAEATDIDTIVLGSGLTPDRVCSIVSRLELAGVVIALAGGRYCRSPSAIRAGIG